MSRIERSLTLEQLTVAWLDGAHEFESLRAYLVGTRDGTPLEATRQYLVGQAVANASRPRQTPDERAAAERAAYRQAHFRLQLAMGIDIEASRRAELHSLRLAVLRYMPRSCEPLTPELADLAPPWMLESLVAWSDQVAAVLDEIAVERRARIRIERKYFAGRSVLYPETRSGLAQLEWLDRRLRDELARSIGRTRLRSLNGDRRALDPRVAHCVEHLLDDARIDTYRVLGEPDRAVEIMDRRCRSADQSNSPQEESPDPDPVPAMGEDGEATASQSPR